MTTYYAAHISSPTVFRKFSSVKKMKETLKRVQVVFPDYGKESRYMVYSSLPADHKPFRILIVPKMGDAIWMETLETGTWEEKALSARCFDMDILTGSLSVTGYKPET